MASRDRQQTTAAERERREQAQAARLDALHQRLAEQVQALRSGADWARWLQVARRFPTYSFGNILLIAAQQPDATAAAGFHAWKALGRHVDKGQRGLQILAPVVRRTAHPAGKDSNPHGASPAEGGTSNAPADPVHSAPDTQQHGRGQVAGFRVAYVWDVSQTSGQPLPTQPRPQLLAGQAPAGLWDSLAALLTDRGFTLERGDCGGANGLTDFAAGKVRVRADVDDAQAVKTLAHEAGHVLLHTPVDFTPAGGATTAGCRGVKEVEAESVAYLIAGTHGLDTGSYSFGYVTGWATAVHGVPPEKVVRDTGQRVLSAARTALAAIQPATAPTGGVSVELTDRIQAGRQQTAQLREHAEMMLVPAPAAVPAPSSSRQVDLLSRLHADAAAFYTTQLAAGPGADRAAAFLAGRAVPPAVARSFELGYAPPGWTALVEHLAAGGYTGAQLLAAGVAIPTRRGTIVDRFRDRLMFPVHAPDGCHIAGFVGRALEPGPQTPKYLNSPDTVLYRKGQVLFGLGSAPGRQSLAAGAVPVLVEGPLDAVAVTAAAGGRHVGIAPCGTALTASQVELLARHAGPLGERGAVVALDGDPAGRQAAIRTYPLLRTAGIWPYAAVLPDGHDPASLAQHQGPAALGDLLDNSTDTPLVDLVVDQYLNRWGDKFRWVEGQLGAARAAATIIAGCPPEQISRQVLWVSGRLGLDPQTVTGIVLDEIGRNPPPTAGARQPGSRDTELTLPTAPAQAAPPAATRTSPPHQSADTESSTATAASPPAKQTWTNRRPSPARGRPTHSHVERSR